MNTPGFLPVLALLLTLSGPSVASEVSTEDATNVSPVFGVALPPGSRDWKFISIAREAGDNNDIRVILGNRSALRAYRRGSRPFPDGTILARFAYRYIASDVNNTIFGRVQSYVAGTPTNVQISVKDSRKYATTGGWGYGQFDQGKANQSVALINTCFACHVRLDRSRDFVFTDYAP